MYQAGLLTLCRSSKFMKNAEFITGNKIRKLKEKDQRKSEMLEY